jgi:hypothetical protein
MPQFKTKQEEYKMTGGINTKVSLYTNELPEFTELTNFNFIKPGALTKRDGSSLYIGATVSGKITGLYSYEKLDGSSYVIATANTNMYAVDSIWNPVATGLANGQATDFQTFNNRLYAANGQNFFKFDGSSSTNFSLPPGSNLGVTLAIGGSLAGGTYFVSYGYLNDNSYYGPTSSTQIISISGSTFLSIVYTGLTMPSGYGISALAFYRSSPGGINLFRTATSGFSTSFTDTGATALTANPEPPYIHFTLAPKFISLYNNQLMLAGFSAFPSTTWFSDIGTGEGIRATNNFEARTNDGDITTAQVPYNGVFLTFKERSFARLSGDNPNTFSLSEVSDQYGCISNRAVVVFNDICWFLDGQKGVMQFNGANIECVSSKIEPILLRMNLDAARQTATAVHDKLNNQVKFSFPVDGASLNNMTVVYDYLVKNWTTETGYMPAVSAIIRGRLSKPVHFYGGYTGTLHYFDPSFLGDNGQGMTCLAKTGFISAGSHSIEKQFRRLFVDATVQGASAPINVGIYQDYGSSLVVSRTIYQNPFQNRVDFGIMAKSIAIQLSTFSNTQDTQINGYTVESREQRRV